MKVWVSRKTLVTMPYALQWNVHKQVWESTEPAQFDVAYRLFWREPDWDEKLRQWAQGPEHDDWCLGIAICQEFLDELNVDASRIDDEECGEYDLSGKKPRLVCVWQKDEGL